MKTKVVREFISGISDTDVQEYCAYMDRLAPDNANELFFRYVFAYCSIQTSWRKNVELYKVLSENPAWVTDQSLLEDILVGTAAGLHNNRAKYLRDFASKYVKDQSTFQKRPTERWEVFRDRVVSSMQGMGIAKVSFSAEMIYPLETDVVCLDRHMLRFMGHDKENVTYGQYRRYELYWARKSREAGIPPAVTRWIYWDKVQNQPDSRYWTHILEKPKEVSYALRHTG